MKLKPLGLRVLVKRNPLPEQTEGGLFLLGREFPVSGTVVAIGNGKKFFNKQNRLREQTIETVLGDIQIGDEIVFERDAIRQGRDLGDNLILLDASHCELRLRK